MNEMPAENKHYYLDQAAYWEVVMENAEGFALEQAEQQRKYYLRLLGMIAGNPYGD